MSYRRFGFLAVLLVSLNVALWLVQTGFALPQDLIDRFFGPRMVRAEVVVQSGAAAVRDFRIDRGKIVAATPGSITLRERDGTVVTIQVAAGARIVGLARLNGGSQLQSGLRVLVVRQANSPAHLIQVEAKG
jgi:hypothetical protein